MVKLDATANHPDNSAASTGTRAPKRRRPHGRGIVLCGACALLLLVVGPFVFGTYLLNILIQAFFFSIAAITVDILWGYTGYLTFGQSAFFGLGAYAAGLVFTHGGFSAGYVVLALGVAIVVAAAVAVVLGWLSF